MKWVYWRFVYGRHDTGVIHTEAFCFRLSAAGNERGSASIACVAILRAISARCQSRLERAPLPATRRWIISEEPATDRPLRRSRWRCGLLRLANSLQHLFQAILQPAPDTIWKTLEDRVAEMSKRVGQSPVPAPPAGPPQRTIRGRFFASDPPPRRW
jgi:hypothetical protein